MQLMKQKPTKTTVPREAQDIILRCHAMVAEAGLKARKQDLWLEAATLLERVLKRRLNEI